MLVTVESKFENDSKKIFFFFFFWMWPRAATIIKYSVSAMMMMIMVVVRDLSRCAAVLGLDQSTNTNNSCLSAAFFCCCSFWFALCSNQAAGDLRESFYRCSMWDKLRWNEKKKIELWQYTLIVVVVCFNVRTAFLSSPPPPLSKGHKEWDRV